MKRIRSLLVVPVVIAGCSSSGDDSPSRSTGPASSADTSAAAAVYVDRVNRLCRQLIPKVLAVRIGPSGSVPTMRQYVLEQPKLAKVYETFDGKVDAVPVGEGAQSAADVFHAYRQWLDRWDGRLRTAAATGEAKKFTAAQHRLDQAFNSAVEPSEFRAAGFECPAR